jgi:flagellar hook-length control protein FliK
MLSQLTNLLGLNPAPKAPDTRTGDKPAADFASFFAHADPDGDALQSKTGKTDRDMDDAAVPVTEPETEDPEPASDKDIEIAAKSKVDVDRAPRQPTPDSVAELASASPDPEFEPLAARFDDPLDVPLPTLHDKTNADGGEIQTIMVPSGDSPHGHVSHMGVVGPASAKAQPLISPAHDTLVKVAEPETPIAQMTRPMQGGVKTPPSPEVIAAIARDGRSVATTTEGLVRQDVAAATTQKVSSFKDPIAVAPPAPLPIAPNAMPTADVATPPAVELSPKVIPPGVAFRSEKPVENPSNLPIFRLHDKILQGSSTQGVLAAQPAPVKLDVRQLPDIAKPPSVFERPNAAAVGKRALHPALTGERMGQSIETVREISASKIRETGIPAGAKPSPNQAVTDIPPDLQVVAKPTTAVPVASDTKAVSDIARHLTQGRKIVSGDRVDHIAPTTDVKTPSPARAVASPREMAAPDSGLSARLTDQSADVVKTRDQSPPPVEQRVTPAIQEMTTPPGLEMVRGDRTQKMAALEIGEPRSRVTAPVADSTDVQTRPVQTQFGTASPQPVLTEHLAKPVESRLEGASLRREEKGDPVPGMLSISPQKPLTSAPPVAPPIVFGAPLAPGGRVTSPLLADLLDDGTDLDLQTAGPGQEVRLSSASPIVPSALPTRGEVSPILRQLAEGMGRLGDGTVEIRLSPEELGQVRMQLVQGDSGLTVHITADRPETLDLMRRHIDQLARDLAESGYGGAEFSFGQGGDEKGQPQSRADEEASGLLDQPITHPLPAEPVIDGLDLRL